MEEFNFSDNMNLSQDESNCEEFSPRRSKRHILKTAHFFYLIQLSVTGNLLIEKVAV